MSNRRSGRGEQLRREQLAAVLRFRRGRLEDLERALLDGVLTLAEAEECLALAASHLAAAGARAVTGSPREVDAPAMARVQTAS